MYKVSDLKKQSYKVNEVAKILGVTTKTIRNYDERGVLKAERTVGNHRVIMRDELIRFLDEKGLVLDDTLKGRRDIVYARVSSHDQKQHGDLDRHVIPCRRGHIQSKQEFQASRSLRNTLTNMSLNILPSCGKCGMI